MRRSAGGLTAAAVLALLGACSNLGQPKPLPVTESVLAEYAQLMEMGFGDEDISAIYRLSSKIFPDKFA